MAFELDRLTDYSNEAIIEEIRRVAALLAVPELSEAEFLRHARVSRNTIRRRFGGWSKAAEASGLAALAPRPRSRGKSTTTGRGLDAEQVVEEIRRVAGVAGTDFLTVQQFNLSSTLGAGVVRSRFGSWQAALVAAGLAPNPRGRRYADRECYENLLAVWTHHGRPPQYREMVEPPSAISGKPYVARWGSWNKALAAFVEYTKRDVGDDASPSPVVRAPSITRSARQGSRDVPVGLRYRVLVRDRFRCVICGASPATHIGCDLHVDHILAFSKGGATAEDNLRTLCRDCNLGKADRLEGAG
jgi:hypothetical protein